MKKLVFVLFIVLTIVNMSGCSNKSNSLECSLEQVTYKYVYNESNLLEFWINGEKQIQEILELEQSNVPDDGRVEEYIYNVKISLERFGASCKMK